MAESQSTHRDMVELLWSGLLTVDGFPMGALLKVTTSNGKRKKFRALAGMGDSLLKKGFPVVS